MNEPTNHVVKASLLDAQDTIAALMGRWPQVHFAFSVDGKSFNASLAECAVGECLWEADPDAPAGEKGTRCSVCGSKTPF